MINSADPWLIQILNYLDLHCLLRQGISCLAREGLKGQGFSQTFQDVFLAVVDLLNIKIFYLRHFNKKDT